MRRAAVVVVLLALVASRARAAGFPVFAGDPVDPATGAAYPVLPGVPLIVPPPHGENVTIDPSIVGDVDLVVRAGTMVAGPAIPAPASPPVAATAGGALGGATDVPFTVIVSDGTTPPATGSPLLGPEMDGIPVAVFAWADLDGDGFVGPTDADVDGAADDARELQEALHPVGRQVALLQNGVATGSIAIERGAPASAGGLRIVLTAVAYVGPFVPGFLAGNVPDGPPIATLLPFFPDLDPAKIVDGAGRGGRAASDVRTDLTLEPVFDPTPGDAVLGTPFALPTDGSSPTIDRAVVASGAFARARFVRPSAAAGFPVGVQVPLFPAGPDVLFEELAGADVADDGPGGGVAVVRLVPVDRLDDVTDPPPGTTATLVAGPGLVIAAPDTDGDPTRETIALAGPGGVLVTLDDAGGVGDSGAGATLTVATGGFPTETLVVRFVPAGSVTTTTTLPGGATTTTIATGGTTTTTTTVPATGAPLGGGLAGCVPPVKNGIHCGAAVLGAYRALVRTALACQCRHLKRRFRNVATADMDEEACEAAARTRFGAVLVKLVGRGVCDPAQEAAAAGVRDELLAALDGPIDGGLACSGTDPLGGDEAGFVPPTRGALSCACAAGQNLNQLFGRMLACDGQLAGKLARRKTANLAACQGAVRGKLDAAAARLAALGVCPDCLDAPAQGALATSLVGLATGDVNLTAYPCP